MSTKERILHGMTRWDSVPDARQRECGGRIAARWELLPVLLLLAAIAAFYALTMRPGELRDDDTAQYIQHAKNISDGAPYDRIPWVYHEDEWNPGPRVYPPVLPLLLAPLYRTFGLDLRPMLFLMLVLFVSSLAVIYLTFRSELGPLAALGLVAIVGFNPYFWELRDSVLSDIPFLGLCYLTLLMVEKAVSHEDSGARFLAYSALTGVVMYAACGTRSVGIVMVPAVLVWCLVRHAKITKSIAVITAICTVLELAEILRLHTLGAYGSAYALETHPTLTVSGIAVQVLRSARYWLGSLSTLWSNGYSRDLGLIFFAFTLIIAFVGLAVQLSQKIRVHEVFGLFYVPALLSWTQMRYLIPLIPLYLFYAIRGVLWLVQRAPRWCAVAVFSVLLAAVALTYASDYYTENPHESAFNTASPQTQQMFAFIRTQTTHDDVIECLAPRILSLYTGRRSSSSRYAPGVTRADVAQYFCRAGITYVVVAADEMSEPVFYDFVQSNRDSWSLVFANAVFHVYRVPAGTCPARVAAERDYRWDWLGQGTGFPRHLVAQARR